jgi:hypothetical protein
MRADLICLKALLKKIDFITASRSTRTTGHLDHVVTDNVEDMDMSVIANVPAPKV